MTKQTNRRAAIYARYSTDKQNVTSLDGQILLCKKHASEKSLPISAEHIFTDSERTSATLFNRPGYAKMIAAAERGDFEVVIVECLDRISRDPADLPHVFKLLTFAQVEIDTVNEGMADDTKIAIRGLLGKMWRKDLADKTRRGLMRVLNAGRIPGLLGYGYRVDPHQKGVYTIDAEQAKIVRRIYKEYLAGVSPRAIAAGLTRDGVPSARGGKWNHAHLIGGGIARCGILSNPIYKGELVWNQTHRVISPKNGNEIKRANDEKDVQRAKVPHLQIVDGATFEAVQTLRAKRAFKAFGEGGKVPRQTHPVIGRNEHAFAALLRCGTCGSPMRLSGTANGHRYSSCAAYGNHSACANALSYNLTKLEKRIRQKLAVKLANREAFMAATAAYYDEWRKGTRKATDDAASLRRQVDRLTHKIQRVDVAIRDSDTPVEELIAQRKPLAIERANLQERLRLAEAESTVVELRPTAMKAFAKSLDEFQAVIAGDEPLGPDDRHIMAAFLDSIIVYPAEQRADVQFECRLRIGAMIGGGAKIFCDNGNMGNPSSPISQAILPLGRWYLAA